MPPLASLVSLPVSTDLTPTWTNAVSAVITSPSPSVSAAYPPGQFPPLFSTLSNHPSLPLLSRPGMILSPATDPIPQGLVQRIQSGQFIEMRDLLADNIALLNQLSSLHGTAALPVSTVSRTRLREVPSLVSWLYCFNTYMAVRTSDSLTRNMLAYSRLIIREALRHGGTGWLDYDRIFRRQLAINPLMNWNALDPSLHAATILGQRSSTGVFCTLCQETDHSTSQCALAPLQQQLRPSTSPASRSLQWPTPYRPLKRPETLMRICVSWNKGSCTRPHCTFRHICATCQKSHKARDCPDTPQDSEYKAVFAPAPQNRN